MLGGYYFNLNDDKNAQSAFTRLRITKFHFVILGGVSANEVNFFAFDLHENSRFKILTEHILSPLIRGGSKAGLF